MYRLDMHGKHVVQDFEAAVTLSDDSKNKRSMSYILIKKELYYNKPDLIARCKQYIAEKHTLSRAVSDE